MSAIKKSDIFYSHDAVSLFTNTPIDKTLDIIETDLLKMKLSRHNQTRRHNGAVGVYPDNYVFFIQKLYLQTEIWSSHRECCECHHFQYIWSAWKKELLQVLPLIADLRYGAGTSTTCLVSSKAAPHKSWQITSTQWTPQAASNSHMRNLMGKYNSFTAW